MVYFSIPDKEDSSRSARRLDRMGHHEDRLPFLVDLRKQREKLIRRPGIKRSCRLIGKDNARICDQCPCRRHSLLLSAGNLIRIFLQKRSDTKIFCNRHEFLHHRLIILPLEHKRQQNIIFYVERIEQIEFLEYKTKIVTPELRDILVFY